jgi:hypothetical protein
MRPSWKTLACALAGGLLLLLPPIYLLKTEQRNPTADPVHVLSRYLRLLYARDFGQAYRFIAAEDQKLKSAKVYVRERGR